MLWAYAISARRWPQLLARHFDSIDELANASREKLMSIPTIGPKIADSIVAFFRQEENRHIIERLKKAGVKLEEKAAKPEELPLAGQEFVITGRLEAFSTAGGGGKDKSPRRHS